MDRNRVPSPRPEAFLQADQSMKIHAIIATAISLVAIGCGNTDSTTRAASQCLTFDNTFDAIQARIFDDGGCSNDACHGESKQGGLDLRAGASFDSLVGVSSTGSSLNRIEPGSANGSYLFHKLAAATAPDQADVINGTPMPVGAEPIAEELLEAMRLWIIAGAPKTGSIGDTSRQSSDTVANLLGACLPEAQPIAVEPLPPPPADKGVQLAMPNFTLERESEVEYCFATYYDFSEVVPTEYQDGESFWYNGARLRMDGQSHHLLITHSGLGPEYVDHETFGAWSCVGGARSGESCDPIDTSGCGAGICTSEIRNSLACTEFGPPEGGGTFGSSTPTLGGIGSTQEVIPPSDGAFVAFPIRGIIYWNPHAFNLTKEDHVMHAWANVTFTNDRRFQRVTSTDVSSLYDASGIPPFAAEERCATLEAPLESAIVSMSSHTHKRGSDFRVWMPDGSLVYQSFHYADPLRLNFDPPIAMDDPDPAGRTLRFCAMFNNGVNPDGSPNPETVTRKSRMPDRADCHPIACVEGRVGERCDGADDHAACDTEPGVGDGLCDACAITSGVTTENEMFVLTPDYLIPAE